MDPTQKHHDKTKLAEINSHLTCYLCKGYLIDATTISECLHSFCRSCIIKFLQQNCYCPVCEVIINEAKPCLKLDKTLQDIVYKLVPELFTKEMRRRKDFYQDRPAIAAQVSPEQRGEDTERIIFNPQDFISLSIEYVSDDSAPGAISVMSSTTKNGTQLEESQDNTMKRYLQCPGMCNIAVLKKFVRNKYNVDTNLFHIDLLYKRVPLPDHYTLIDIGYIYSWKRNEPMKFFFRITDINKVAERFDYFDGRAVPDVVPTLTKPPKATPKKTSHHHVKVKAEVFKRPIKCVVTKSDSSDKAKDIMIKSEIAEEIKTKIQSGKNDIKNAVYTNITLNRNDNVEIITKIQKVSNKQGQPIGLNIINHTVKKTSKVQSNKTNAKLVPNNNKVRKSPMKEETVKKTEEDVAKSNFLKSIQLTAKSSIVTPSTLLTMHQKSAGSSKREVGIIASSTSWSSHPKREVPTIGSSSSSLPVHPKQEVGAIGSSATSSSAHPKREVATIESSSSSSSAHSRREMATIGSSSMSSTSAVSKREVMTPGLSPKQHASSTHSKREIESSPKQNSSLTHPKREEVTLGPKQKEQKRKNSSPLKNENREKKPKIVNGEKKPPVKIIIQPKSIQNPAVRQIVSNVNQNANSLSKIVEQTTPKTADLRSIIDNCKINIPSSLSITLNEGEKSGRTPPSIPPVKNFIEILKLPESGAGGGEKSGKDRTMAQSFQKIFEESIKKTPEFNNNKVEKISSIPLDLTSSPEINTNGKRNILEIASQLHKKTKLELEKNNEPSLKSVPSPPPLSAQTSANMRSTSLGLNYTVSVGQNKVKMVEVKTEKPPKILSPPPLPLTHKMLSPQPPKRAPTPSTSRLPKSKSLSPKIPPTNSVPNSSGLNPNQLLEKYNIQNLPQLTASFNFNGSGFGGGGNQQLAVQHALFKHIQHQNWLNVNQGPLLQFEKYLQTLSANQNKIMGNIKEN